MNTNETQYAKYITPDNKTMVRGWWVRRGGCLWLGEVTITHSGHVVGRFSSVSPMSNESLAGYANTRTPVLA